MPHRSARLRSKGSAGPGSSAGLRRRVRPGGGARRKRRPGRRPGWPRGPERREGRAGGPRGAARGLVHRGVARHLNRRARNRRAVRLRRGGGGRGSDLLRRRRRGGHHRSRGGARRRTPRRARRRRCRRSSVPRPARPRRRAGRGAHRGDLARPRPRSDRVPRRPGAVRGPRVAPGHQPVGRRPRRDPPVQLGRVGPALGARRRRRGRAVLLRRARLRGALNTELFWRTLVDSRVGAVWLDRLGLALLLAATIVAAARSGRTWLWWAATAAGALLLMTLSGLSHAATGRPLPLLADWAHAAAAVW